MPTYLPLSFFPQEPYHGSLQITNTHPTISIRNLTVDASQLDLAAPSGQKLQVSFSDGTSVYSLSALAGKESIQVPFTATVAPNYLDTRFVGEIVVQGNYDFSLDGLPKVGTTTTKVAVFFAQPTDLLTEPIHVINDETDGNLNDLQYVDPSFLHSVTSSRTATGALLKPATVAFGMQRISPRLRRRRRFPPRMRSPRSTPTRPVCSGARTMFHRRPV